MPGGHKPPVLSPSTSGEAEPSTGTSSKASSATSTQSRHFKFKIGKPKRPRKKPYQGSPYGGLANAQTDINCVSGDANNLYEDQPETLQRDQYNGKLHLPISGAIWEAVLPNRVQELSGSDMDPDEDITGFEQEKRSLTASVPSCEVAYCISGSSVRHPPLFGSLEDKYSGVLLMCKPRSF